MLSYTKLQKQPHENRHKALRTLNFRQLSIVALVLAIHKKIITQNLSRLWVLVSGSQYHQLM